MRVASCPWFLVGRKAINASYLLTGYYRCVICVGFHLLGFHYCVALRWVVFRLSCCSNSVIKRLDYFNMWMGECKRFLINEKSLYMKKWFICWEKNGTELFLFFWIRHLRHQLRKEEKTQKRIKRKTLILVFIFI